MWWQKENIGEGWSRQSLELDELTAQGDKVTCKTADGNLFTAALSDPGGPGHVLNPLLPTVKTVLYSLGWHNRIVQQVDKFDEENVFNKNAL